MAGTLRPCQTSLYPTVATPTGPMGSMAATLDEDTQEASAKVSI